MSTHPEYEFRADLIRIIDGDTVVMRCDVGFRLTAEHSFRLVGVNAPELFAGTNRTAGAVAKADCQKWLWEHQHQDVAWPYVVRTVKDKQTFGRYLATVYDLEGRCLNDHLMGLPWQEERP